MWKKLIQDDGSNMADHNLKVTHFCKQYVKKNEVTVNVIRLYGRLIKIIQKKNQCDG